MSALDVTRAELALAVLYLNKAETRDKICRSIQYGSRFLSNGEPGTAQNVEKSVSLARKVFRLFKFINDLHALISPSAPGTPITLILLGKSKNALLSTFLFLDQFVWLGRSGIYKNKESTELIGRISLFCWLGSSICSTLVEIGEIGRLSISMKKLEKELKNTNKYKVCYCHMSFNTPVIYIRFSFGALCPHRCSVTTCNYLAIYHISCDLPFSFASSSQNEQYKSKVQESNERSLAFVKATLDIVVAVGLLKLAPNKVTPRVSGVVGFVSSLISCYQLLPSPPKAKTT